jgi:uncharacterized membrane protein YedE/YeeE
MVGAIAPVSLSVIVGSFIFGFAMQLGGGCGSGTLFTAASGNIKMFITLIFFIIGSLVGTYHFSFWSSLPSLVQFRCWINLIHMKILGCNLVS